MAKKTYWKDIRKSFGSSKGRFLSIMLLMMLGAFAFVGLKVTGPDMQATASQYLKKHNTMDLSVIASYGFSDDDKEELDSIKNADVEYGYLTDVTVRNTDDAIRVFSKSTSISTYELVSGRLPKSSDEIALASTMKDDYKVGDTISFTQSDEDGILKNTTYKVVGFVNSSEILSTTSLGSSTAGDGSLSNYAVVTESAFDTDTYTIARIRYDDLKTLNPFSESYKQKVADKQNELDDLLSDNAEQRLASLKSDAQVDANQEKVDSAKAQLAAQESALASLSAEQQAAAQSSIDQAQAEITESESEIQEAQAKIDAMTEPTYTSYTRSTLPGGEGYQTYESSTSSISSIGNIFPVVLYVVAALVTFTTMTRFVDEERTNSGILKALGYSNSDVIKKFVIYGFVASMIGTVLGIVAGHYLLSRIIAQIVTSDTTLGETHLYFYWNYTAIALVLALISAVLPAFLIAKNELSEKPAQLLLPKPPVKGSKIFLERIGVIWRRLSFTHKVTARNIFRYKQRMLMTIFGVAGSVALLFAGLGIRSSLGNVIENQFTNLMPYDMIVVKNDDNSSSENQEVKDFMDSNKVSQCQSIYFTTLSETISGLTDKQTVSIMVSSGDDFGDFIHLKDASSGDSLTLSDDGIIISEKLASLYHVEAGDSFTLKDSDGKKHTVKVAAVAEMNVGHYLFMSQKVYQKIFGETPNDNAYLVTLKNDSSSNIEKLSTKLLAMSGVSAVSQNSSLVKTVKSVVASLNGAMTILIVVSILLAVVILYNLTNINVAERIRELSTIKVLGFYDKEVTMYIYRETISLSLIGIIVGLIGGKYLHQVIMGMIGSDSIMFGTTVGWDIYVIPIAVIVIILLALGWLVNHILKTVDMLEALKSVD